MQTKKCLGCLEDLALSRFSKDAQSPDGLARRCRSCRSIASKKYRHDPANKEKVRQWGRDWDAKNQDKIKARRVRDRAKNAERSRASYLKNKNEIARKHKNWRLNNLEKCARLQALYRSKNREKTREAVRKSMAKDPAARNAASARYRSAKANRCPKWVGPEERLKIKQLYMAARDLTEETGKTHHVDHIVPLFGKLVSGLHVLCNLQILSAKSNIRKNNKWVPR